MTQKTQVVPDKRRFEAINQLDHDAAVSELISHSFFNLLVYETRLAPHRLETFLDIQVPAGNRFVLVTYASNLSTQAQTSPRDITARLWVGAKPAADKSFRLERSGEIVTSAIKTPEWWDITDDMTVGDQPAYLEDLVAEHAA